MAHRNVGFLEARKIVENGHNPTGQILLSLKVRKASEGTLNLIWGTSLLLKRQED
jgi:hypothetical protein